MNPGLERENLIDPFEDVLAEANFREFFSGVDEKLKPEIRSTFLSLLQSQQLEEKQDKIQLLKNTIEHFIGNKIEDKPKAFRANA